MSRARMYCGDALAVLKMLPEESVQCCVTSPPYWGLRDYGTAKWNGGDSSCDHSPERRGGRFATPVSAKQRSNTGSGTISQRQCACGAQRIDEQIGLEPTPDAYVVRLVEVLGEVRRVLCDDGTLWLNLGDSYASGGSGGYSDKSTLMGFSSPTTKGRVMNAAPLTRAVPDGLKAKDLVGIPWRVAFALQSDGWWLRSDIVWSKSNPMPESVTDRPTRSHEYVFLLSKSARYYYDAAAIRRPMAETSVARLAQDVDAQHGSERANGGAKANGTMKAVRRSDKQRGHSRWHDGFNDRWDQMTREEQMAYGANARTVWDIATQPYAEAHFATFPEELARRCILAGSRPGDTVLDPFGGSGTVAQVATGNGRASVYIDLNPAYVELARHRIGTLLCDQVPA